MVEDIFFMDPKDDLFRKASSNRRGSPHERIVQALRGKLYGHFVGSEGESSDLQSNKPPELFYSTRASRNVKFIIFPIVQGIGELEVDKEFD